MLSILHGNRRVSKYALTAIAAIVLGALGSGLWEAILRPALRHLSYWLLDFAAFGLQSYRVGIYQEIAQRAPHTNVNIFATVTFLWFSVLYGVALYFLISSKQANRQLKRLREELRGATGDPKKPEDRAAQLAARLDRGEKMASRLRGYVYALIVMVGCIIAYHFVLLAKSSYTTLAVAHFDQALTIAAPYVEQNERLLIESQFAQIRDKQGYERVVGELASVARDHGQYVPGFNAW
jgi:hypothetical protein